MQIIADCEDGTVPPTGAAYGMNTIVDKSMDKVDDVYFEAGDHRTLVHLKGAQYV